MGIINLSEIKVRKIQTDIGQNFMKTTEKFNELLEVIKGNDSEEIKLALTDLFNDFEETRYLLIQFKTIEDLIRPFIDDEFIMELLAIVKGYILLDTKLYASDFESLDENGRIDARAINIKQDLLEVCFRLGRLLKNKENQDKFDLEFKEIKDIYSKFHAQFEKILRERS